MDKIDKDDIKKPNNERYKNIDNRIFNPLNKFE